MAGSRKLRLFRKWMKHQGIECSDSLELIESSSSSSAAAADVSVRALSDLHIGDVVATIPKSSCLTVKTSAAHQLIEESQLEGCLALSVAVMYERSLGSISSWFGYLNLLPFSEPIPLLWSRTEIDSFLKGTEIHKIVKDDKEIIYEDWKEFIEPLLNNKNNSSRIKPECFGVDDYFAAKSLIASRSFEIDEYHGSGMVPLADLFNHKTGAEDVHFTLSHDLDTDNDSDNDEDSDGNNNNNESSRSVLEDDADNISNDESCRSKLDDDEENNNNDESSHSRLDDSGNCKPAEANSNDESLNKSSSEVSSVSGEDDVKTLEMIMVKEVKTGVEVFNTYGCSGNAALLHRYGFAEPDNPYDIVNLDLELVLKWSSSRFSRRHTRRRLALWRKLDYSGCVSQNSEYFEVSFDGEPQVELLVLLYTLLLPEKVCADVDLAVSLAGDFEKLSELLNKDDILLGKGSELSNSVLLTEGVCIALLELADIRESLYGSNCLEDDIKAWDCCSLMKEPKRYYSLVLRISERKILEKLRCYAATSSAMMPTKEGGKTRKRAKIA